MLNPVNFPRSGRRRPFVRTLAALGAALCLAAPAAAQPSYVFVVGGKATGNAAPDINSIAEGIGAIFDDNLYGIWAAEVDTVTPDVTNWKPIARLPKYYDNNTTRPRVHWGHLYNNVHIFRDQIYIGPSTRFDTPDPGPFEYADFIVHAPFSAGPVIRHEDWQFSPRFSDSYPTGPDGQSICATAIIETPNGAFFYVFGGLAYPLTTSRILYSRIDDTDGTLGPWQETTSALPNPGPDWFNAAVPLRGYVYHTGGALRGSMSIDFFRPLLGPDIDGTTQPITSRVYSTDFPGRWNAMMVAVEHTFNLPHIFILGGTRPGINGNAINRVDRFIPNSFTQDVDIYPNQPPMPVARRRTGAAVVQDLIIIPGGSPTELAADAVDTVLIGRCTFAGNLSWSFASEPLPMRRSYHGVAAAGPGVVPAAPTAARDWEMFE